MSPSLEDLSEQSAVLSAQVLELIRSVRARSAQYVALTAAHHHVLASSVEAVVEDAEACCALAERMQEAAREMDAELARLDDVERVVRRTKRIVLDIDRRVQRAIEPET